MTTIFKYCNIFKLLGISILLGPLLNLSTANAKFFNSPMKLLKIHFPNHTHIQKRSILIPEDEKIALQKLLKTRLPSKLFQFYIVREKAKIIGYGCLLTRKIKSRNMTALYIISPTGVLQSLEMVAFHEPIEYAPTLAWRKKFKGKTSSSPLRLRSDIPHISGATLSARKFTQGAKLTLQVWQQHKTQLDL